MCHHYFPFNIQRRRIIFILITMCLLTICSLEAGIVPSNQAKADSSGSLILHETNDGELEKDEDFCIDTDGVKRGIFSSWRDNATNCQCSCHSVGNVLVVLCDESCEQREWEDDQSPPQNDEPLASLVYHPKEAGSTKVEPKIPLQSLTKPTRRRGRGKCNYSLTVLICWPTARTAISWSLMTKLTKQPPCIMIFKCQVINIFE